MPSYFPSVICVLANGTNKQQLNICENPNAVLLTSKIVTDRKHDGLLERSEICVKKQKSK